MATTITGLDYYLKQYYAKGAVKFELQDNHAFPSPRAGEVVKASELETKQRFRDPRMPGVVWEATSRDGDGWKCRTITADGKRLDAESRVEDRESVVLF